MYRYSSALKVIIATFVLGTLCTIILKADSSDWTPEDSKAENAADALYNQGQLDAAEEGYRKVLERHPDSATALMYDVKGLNALWRIKEALPEAQKAVELASYDGIAQEWLGMTLVLSGKYSDAIPVLEKSLSIAHNEETSSIWLAQAYLLSGKQARSGEILEGLLKGRTREQQSVTADRIANGYYQMGNSAAAATWWLRAAKLGSKDAAKWLSWAYSVGYGVSQDTGDSDYWSRRTDDPSYPWFPRLSNADELVNWASGWGLVALILATTIILPITTIGTLGFVFSRQVTKNPRTHWSERARRSYPFQLFLAFGSFVLPLVYLAEVDNYPGSFLPIPKWILIWLAFAIAAYVSNWTVVWWASRYRDNPGTALQNLQDIGTIVVIYLPTMIVLFIMSLNLPPQWGIEAALVIGAGVIAYFWLQYGGCIRVARLSGLLIPADSDLREDTALIAQQAKHPLPSVWIIRWRKANAFAYAFANAIVVSTKLRSSLSREEIKSVLAHELAHLCEDRGTRMMRLFGPLVFLLPLFTVSLWAQTDTWEAILACYAFLIIGFFVMAKRARRMEERADNFGKEAETQAGTYPLALAKLYEANSIPAVMPGKRKIHPHLYDRLLSSGITPDFPRPKPPARWGIFAGLLLVAVNIVCLTAIWLLLF